jgi:hypothetical protein
MTEGSENTSPPPKKKERELSQADLLVQVALAKAELFHDECDEAYLTIPCEGSKETMKLRSKRAHGFLAHEFYRVFGRAPGGQAKADALTVLEGVALYERGVRAASLRTCEHEGRIYIDLANPHREVVQVDAGGWRIVRGESPVHFVRPKAMAPLPPPQRGGSVDELRRIVNVKREHHFRLLVAWILGALRPRGPYPILFVQGEAGSAKSMLSRIARSFVDPNVSPLRTAPRDERDLAIAARHMHAVAYENLSSIAQWLSDALCRVSTGGGFSTRQLCTDDEEVVFDYRRPVLINGIDDLAVQPDLADRCIVLALRRIPDAERRCEKDLLTELAAVAPRVFGALLDALAGALARIDEVHLPALPRMADFARFVTAAEPALGWKDGAFMEAYSANRTDVAAAALDASTVAQAVTRLFADRGEWVGQPARLLEELNRLASESERSSKHWPKAANVLTSQLRRDAPVLRERGIHFEEGHEGRGNTKRRVIALRTVMRGSVPTGPSVPEAPAGTIGHDEATPLNGRENRSGDDGDDGDDPLSERNPDNFALLPTEGIGSQAGRDTNRNEV